MIPKVFKNNIGLPWCFYYLGVAEYLLQEADNQCKNNECLRNIDEKIQEIQVYITIAIEIYAGEDKTQSQKRGFCKKKRIIKSNLDKLKAKAKKRNKKKLWDIVSAIPFFI